MKFGKTPSILICTHGSLCEGLLDTAEMVYGNLNEVFAMPLVTGMSIDEYEKKVEEFIISKEGNVVLLLDIVGGSPYNTAMKLSQNYELCAIAGVNFGMLLKAIEIREQIDDSGKFAEEVASGAIETIRNVTPDLLKMHEFAKDM